MGKRKQYLTGDARDQTRAQVRKLREAGLTWRQIADVLGLSRGTVKHLLRECAPASDARGPAAPERTTDPAAAEQERPALPVHHRRPTAPRVMLNAAVYDVEVTDFGTEGYFGHMIMCCILPLNSDEVQTIGIRFDEHRNDWRVVHEISAALARYDVLIGHNIAAFDYNWINARLMFWGMPPMRAHLYFDTYQVAKSLALKTRKGLGNLLDYFGLDGTKTSIFRTSWSKVDSPYQWEFDETYAEVKYHCEQDVLGNRRLFDVLYPYSLSTGTNPFKLAKYRGAWTGAEGAAARG